MEASKQTNKTYASFWIRLLAMSIDGMILMIATIVVMYVLSLNIDSLPTVLSRLILFFAFIAVFSILINNILYDSGLISRFGTTIGKAVCGLRVENENGENLTFWQAAFRHTIGYSVSSLLFGAGFYWVFKNIKHQGWHDKAIGSYVVKKSEKRWSIALIILAILIATYGVAVYGFTRNIIDNPTIKEGFSQLMKTLKEESVKNTTDTLEQELPNGLPQQEKEPVTEAELIIKIEDNMNYFVTAREKDSSTLTEADFNELAKMVNETAALTKELANNYPTEQNYLYAGDIFYNFIPLCGAGEWSLKYFELALEQNPQDTDLKSYVDSLKQYTTESPCDPTLAAQQQAVFTELDTKNL